MKFFKRTIFYVSLILTLLTTYSLANTATVNIEATRIREEKSTDSKIITVVYKEDEIEILEKEEEWCKVKYKENIGFVKTEFLKFNSDEKNSEEKKDKENSNNLAKEQTPKEKKEPLKENELEIIDSAELKLTPNFSSKTINVLESGKRLTIIKKINNWVKVTDNDLTGWILEQKSTREIIEEKEEENKVDTDIKNETNITNTVEETENLVQNDVVENNINTVEIENVTNTSEESSRKVGKVNVETAKLRKEASTSSENIDLLDYDDIVNIIGEEGDWYKITYNDSFAYISKKLVTIEKNSSRSSTEERKEIDTQKDINTEETENKDENKDENIETKPTTKASEVVEFAKGFLYYPYVTGGKTPETGFDCSGFTRYVFKNFGYNLASVAAEQTSVGTEISREELLPGDLILLQNEEKTKIGHTRNILRRK